LKEIFLSGYFTGNILMAHPPPGANLKFKTVVLPPLAQICGKEMRRGVSVTNLTPKIKGPHTFSQKATFNSTTCSSLADTYTKPKLHICAH
jgi:hypothetical protein